MSAIQQTLFAREVRNQQICRCGDAFGRIPAEPSGDDRLYCVHPLTRLPEFGEGDDLAAALGDALVAHDLHPRSGDVLVVTQKIVSKVEARFRNLADIEPSDEARVLAARTGKDARLVELILHESVTVVRAAPHVLITRHRLGLTMANAGIDQSNLGTDAADRVLLLPSDPDGSAHSIRAAMGTRFGAAPGIVISDSFGRPWRHGVTQVAIGAAGVPALIDRRGDTDRDGRVLEVTQIGQADMIACAAGLAMGEGSEGVPAALVRGLPLGNHADRPAGDLVRPAAEDLFR